jgi:hypothetical protein
MTSIISLLKNFLLINVCSSFIYTIPSYSLSKYNKPNLKTLILNHNKSSSFFKDKFIPTYKSNFFIDLTGISLFIYLFTYYCKIDYSFPYAYLLYHFILYIISKLK